MFKSKTPVIWTLRWIATDGQPLAQGNAPDAVRALPGGADTMVIEEIENRNDRSADRQGAGFKITRRPTIGSGKLFFKDRHSAKSEKAKGIIRKMAARAIEKNGCKAVFQFCSSGKVSLTLDPSRPTMISFLCLIRLEWTQKMLDWSVDVITAENMTRWQN